RWGIGHTQLSKVANKEKMLPKSFIRKDGFGITPSCRAYLQPLIEGEDYPPFKDGLPQYVRLENRPVEKKLPPFEIR
ncbi:MAG: diphosphate--fructose-6-phosphate 1-phosphotransferase, partial [Gammaproteobacteria bacterium]|nr:diphosphate--fructose-6-phosphate 1-phosphotransferase [Gammaproteobacteria bacterium]